MSRFTQKQIISDEEIEKVHAYANFGPTLTKREVVDMGVLKVACHQYQGHTSKMICIEHGLVDENYELTDKGREYLWAAHCGEHPNF